MARRRKNNRKWIIGGAILIVVLIVVGVWVWQNNKQSKNDEMGQGDMTVVEEENGIDDGEDEGKTEEELIEEKKVIQYDGEDPNEADELSGVVTYAGVVDDKLMIRVNIDQFLADGSCELKLVRNNSTIYNSTANIFADVSTSTCEGFDVPVSGLGSGNTNIEIQLKSGDKSGIIRGEVNI